MDQLKRHAPKFSCNEEEESTGSKRMKYEERVMPAASGQFASGSTKLLSDYIIPKMASDVVSIVVQSNQTFLRRREDLLKPGNFDTLICCARNMAGYEENDGSSSKKRFKAPATAVHCGYELKRAAMIL